MSILFEAYELLSKSGLFDAAFYARVNPDLAALNIDPLTHYLEKGCHERRDPSRSFDTSYYLSQCEILGEAPDNALLHYLAVGAARGLRARPLSGHETREYAGKSTGVVSTAAETARPGDVIPSERLLYVDVPHIVNGSADAPVHGGLSIVGWALARDGVSEVEVALDGRRVAVAYFGIRRPDVASAYPSWNEALQSGFAAHVPPKALTAGHRVVTVTARDRAGGMASSEFAINVEELSDHTGPWSLRRKMGQVEVEMQLAILEMLSWRPSFKIFLPLTTKDDNFVQVRRTLGSLVRQMYPEWQLCLVPAHPMTPSGRATDALLAHYTAGFEDVVPHTIIADEATNLSDSAQRPFIFAVAPGDEFGCNALLEFALSSGFERKADLIYCDDRRKNPGDRKPHAFFKPQWSPDLLLSTNYIGRSWCASSELLDHAGLGIRDLNSLDDYEIVLRLTEAARCIRHIPKLLYERAGHRLDDTEGERRALAAALKRRNIAGEILAGITDHYYRVKRNVPARELVSIIVPTCAAGGLIERCIGSLRDCTAYRNYEIVCVENIPNGRSQWKKWLGKHADLVITINETFNWSRFNNRAAVRASGKHFLFLNDDVEIIEPDWLDALLEHSQRSEVGVVGPQLLYPDRSVQHAGVMLDSLGRGRHPFRHLRQDDPGYFGLALTQRNVISLTGACLMTRRDTFTRLGRFERAHAVVNGDLDYCLRSWNAGLLNIYTPYARLIHHELASRSQLEEQYNARVFKKRWRGVIMRGDPYFNPQLSLDHDQIEIEREPVEEIYAGHPLFAKESVRRILVVKLDHIGDAITALQPVRRLKRAFPGAKITVLAGRGTLPVWKSEPSVDNTLEFNFFHVRSGLGTIKVKETEVVALKTLLHQKRFDLAIDLRKQPDTRHILQFSGARILAGFDHHGRFPLLDVAIEWDEDVPLRAKRSHVTEDLNMLVDAVVARSEPALPVLLLPRNPLKLANGLTRRLFSRPLVCVHAAAGSEMRQWPLPHFSELIDLLLSEGNLNVALIGGSEESEVVAEVLKGVTRRKQVFNLANKVSLTDLPKLLARAALFVGNNSGPQHLAASLGVPTLGIHSGVVDAHEWGPVGPRAMAIRRQMSCSPCFIEKAKDCPRALACLTGMESREVFRRCKRMLLLGKGFRSATSVNRARATL
jgi:ADP-heptose:LPS heptosyltransferase/GT2 family glycosyltransferase